jgi:predicted nucleic acid-binding protein
MIGIINSSPLIYLSKIGALTFLPKLFTECYTTLIVKEEVLSDEKAPEFSVLEESFSSWLSLKEPTNQQLVNRLKELNIHTGEASVLALAKELQDSSDETVMIIDDLAAREIARTFDLQVTGTIGVLIKSLNLKFITKEKCKNYLHILVENTTFRISASLFSKILKKIEKIRNK